MMVTRVLAGLAILAAVIGAGAVAAQERRLSRWLPTPAVILESREETVRTRSGTHGRPHLRVRIRYRYRAGDDERESHRIYPGPMSTTAGESASLRARFPVGAAATAYVDPSDPTRAFLVPQRSFLPYLLVLLVAAPLGALAAGLATGGLRLVRSGEREHAAPREDERGRFVVPAFRPYLALRDSSAAALAVFALVGGVALVDYFGREAKPGGTAVLALLAWLCLLARLLWAVAKRTWVGRRLDEGRLAIRPRYPEAGRTLHVVFEQPVRTDVFVRAVDLTLIAERSTVRVRAGKVRSKTVRVVRQRLRVPVAARARPATKIQVEGAFEVSPDGVPGDGFLRWRVEARTRVFGPDYATRFPIGAPDEVEDHVDGDEGG